MGCTSSTPNMANSNTAEKSIKFQDKNNDNDSNYEEEIIYRAADDLNVLPSCDTLPEPVHLDRNKSTSSFKNEYDNNEAEHKIEIANKVDSRNSLHQEDKVPKLEEVVEKVVELHHMTEHVTEPQPVIRVAEEPPKTEENTDNQMLTGSIEVEVENKDIPEDEEEQEEDLEEALSPTQSESSRATRWEALADIAAELPASLTIDPVTGQIYALSK